MAGFKMLRCAVEDSKLLIYRIVSKRAAHAAPKLARILGSTGVLLGCQLNQLNSGMGDGVRADSSRVLRRETMSG